MDISQAQSWIMIIMAVAAAGGSLIAAWRTGKVSTQMAEVHTLVNSQATADHAKIDLLQNLLVAKQLEIEATERIRGTLARAVAADLKKTTEAPVEPVEPADVGMKGPVERKAPTVPKGKK